MLSSYDIISITKARGKLGILAEKVEGNNYIILTKGGEPKAVLVDPKYLKILENEVSKIYQKTYIDPTLLSQTRIFSDKEIEEWLKEDKH